MIDIQDTIAALSSSPGTGGIAVVKISGPLALRAAQAVFCPNTPQDPWPPRRMILGTVIDENGQSLDQALACLMPAPHSYTTQDVVEIQTHGGPAAPSVLLDLLCDQGVRMAQPGEFTRRAFLLGRIDLAQAEAVADVIFAKTRAGLIAAEQQLSGALSQRIKDLRDTLLEARALLEANIDFPEEEIGTLDRPRVGALCDEVIDELLRLLSTFAAGRLYREGALCVIAGRPNVGKSSLLNRLVQKRRAIVTSTPGTTRDAIEETINLDGVPFRLVDTAGIRDSADPIEGEGVKITREQIESADLVLLLCDAAQGLCDEDLAIGQELAGRNRILLVNKADRVDAQTAQTIAERFGENSLVISAKTGQGEAALQQAMLRAVRGGQPLPANETILTNARHRQAVDKGHSFVQKAKTALFADQSPEFIALELADAMAALGEVIGQTAPDEILNLIFSRFCIGK